MKCYKHLINCEMSHSDRYFLVDRRIRTTGRILIFLHWVFIATISNTVATVYLIFNI